MTLTLIAAIGKNNELGKNNDLIWRFSEDMQFFRENTINKPILMGRKTLESLPKLLPNRKHYVITNQDINIDGVTVFHSKEEAVNYFINTNDEVMVIGGASIYKMFIDDADTMLLTEIDKVDHQADTYFPKFNKDDWMSQLISCHQEDNITYKHMLYKRKK